jgi:glycosyltransferase involved in cell wall biosynthesis
MSDIVEPFGAVVRDLGYALATLPRTRSFDAGRLVRLTSLFRRSRVDLVHAVHLLASGYSWLASRFAPGVCVLPSVRGSTADPGALRMEIYRRMFRSSRRILVNSHQGAEFLTARFGAPAGRLAIIPTGVDFQALRREGASERLRPLLGLGPDDRLLGFVGKDSAVKNTPLFLGALRRLLPRADRLHAVLFGSGLDESYRSRNGQGLPADRVHFLGPQPSLHSLYSGMDLLVVTSRSEGCPNAVLEALALGIPVVSTDVGDVGRIVRTGKSGIIVPTPEPGPVADAIEEALSRIDDLRRGVRCSWEDLEREYSAESMVERTVRLWAEVLEPAGDGQATARR